MGTLRATTRVVLAIGVCGIMAGCQRQYRAIGNDPHTTTREYFKSTDDYSLRVVLWHSRKNEPNDFLLHFHIGQKGAGKSLKISALKLSLMDSTSHSMLAIIDPVDLNIEPQDVKKWHNISESKDTISGGKVYDLSKESLAFRYHFRDADQKHREKWLVFTAVANIECDGKSQVMRLRIVFKRSLVMNVAGN